MGFPPALPQTVRLQFSTWAWQPLYTAGIAGPLEIEL
jgi:hypothetical protein